MARVISVLLGLGLLATSGVAASFPRDFEEHAVVRESLALVPNAGLDSWNSGLTITER
jgi:hypothetical protein